MNDVWASPLLVLRKSFHGGVVVGSIEKKVLRVLLALLGVALNGRVPPQVFWDCFKCRFCKYKN